MWFDEQPSQRVSSLRAKEATATGAKQLATACPFCLNMMSSAVDTCNGEPLRVFDVAELLLESQSGPGEEADPGLSTSA